MSVAETGTLHHTCFLVRDVEASATRLAATLGVTWSLWTITPSRAWLRGEEVTMTFRIAIAQVGGSSIELISPVSGENVYVEDLATTGEGFHHTCFAYESMDAMQAARDELLADGRTCVQNGEIGDGVGAFYYFDVPELGGLFELLYVAALPEPEMMIG